MKIKKGSKVIVITGKYKGVKSEVLKISKDLNYAWVKDVNIVTKHTKPNPALKIAGGLMKKEAKLHISNISLEK